MCDKVANTYSSTMKFVPECYKTQEMCDKDFNKRFLRFFYIPDHYKTHKMCDKISSNDSVFDKTQQKCNEAVDGCLQFYQHLPLIGLLQVKWLKYFLIYLKYLLIMMQMILTLLFLSDFWLGILNLKNAKHLKENMWRIPKEGGLFACKKMRKRK